MCAGSLSVISTVENSTRSLRRTAVGQPLSPRGTGERGHTHSQLRDTGQGLGVVCGVARRGGWHAVTPGEGRAPLNVVGRVAGQSRRQLRLLRVGCVG